ncbi:hypothetical protein [Rhodococcus sp. BE178]|uniref:hypothetical protein n=1 Tax=Rhodococcus sp. BE178 TaxID=2817737 RepID=UPI003D1CC396
MTNTNPIVGYVVLAKRKGFHQSVGAVWPDRDYVENRRDELATEAKRKGYDIEYIVGEIRGCA